MFDPKIPVLVVDDYSTMVKIIRNLLTQIGFDTIDSANCGEDALGLAQSRCYGLIISDWNMAPMTGFEFLQKLRNGGGPNATTPFLMITAESKTDNIVAARRAGVSSYIVKPFSALLLREKIEQALAAAEVAA